METISKTQDLKGSNIETAMKDILRKELTTKPAILPYVDEKKPETSKLKLKTIIAASALVGALSLQGCVAYPYPGYVYPGYYPAPMFMPMWGGWGGWRGDWGRGGWGWR